MSFDFQQHLINIRRKKTNMRFSCKIFHAHLALMSQHSDNSNIIHLLLFCLNLLLTSPLHFSPSHIKWVNDPCIFIFFYCLLESLLLHLFVHSSSAFHPHCLRCLSAMLLFILHSSYVVFINGQTPTLINYFNEILRSRLTEKELTHFTTGWL